MSTLAAPRLTRWLIRLHRPALAVWTVVLLAVGTLLLWLWGPLADAAAAAWQQYDACAGSGCRYDQDAILRYKDVYTYANWAVLAVPFLVAAWAGAALTGRELELHTAQLAWTQGVSPTRWLFSKLALPAVLVTAGTGLLVLLHHQMWWAAKGRIGNAKTWYDPPTFYAGGPIIVALALAGLFAGVLAGLLLRRSLAALGTAVVAVGALWAGINWALPHLWSPVTSVSSLSGTGPAGAGINVSTGLLTATGERLGDPYCGSGIDDDCATLYDRLGAVSWYHDYHPLSHYWPLQLTASAILLAVAVLLALAAFRVTAARTRSVS
ncbi:ABC transporter permease [Streptomyces sp. S.PB5]|uniref:ABC transporter permease n=1 Tax=Streptomyces sp. S.PB5 TaxID=3020844 RepID=UPI0025AF2918|nr:ABC transporter permease [Streptomyces sp. S.PB5]MDN3028791.1 ABC transporter permease [Streptomyces sp. S.PB5]